MVHLKLPCVDALHLGHRHVIDHIDAPPERYVAFRRVLHNFSAQIFNTDQHMENGLPSHLAAHTRQNTGLAHIYPVGFYQQHA